MKQFILLSVICAICTQANSQWKLTGNAGTNASTNFIGTTDNVAFKIRTNNSVRVTVTEGGRVGIGTASPAGKLHVKGSANTSQLIIDAAASQSNTQPIVRLRNSSGAELMHIHSDDSTNVFIGIHAGRVNSVSGGGKDNTFLGCRSGNSNTTGNDNTAVGENALYNTNTGHSNTAIGESALWMNKGGVLNTSCGAAALFYNSTGDNNTGFGSNAFFMASALDNTSCFGHNSGGVSNVSNRTEIGNTSVSWIGGQVGWSTYSDGRIKDNITENVPGLSFISRLRPVTYNLNIHRQNEMVYKGKKGEQNWDSKYDIEKIKMTGFIAQEVEQAAKACNYDFSGLETPDGEGKQLYSIRYSDFVMPLVKAVQELAKQNEELQSEIKTQRSEIEMLKSADRPNTFNTTSSAPETLAQNSPNPFSSQTEIKFQLPAQYSSAQLLISDERGKQIRIYELRTSAPVIIKSNELSPGIYSYSLIINGITVKTRHMNVIK